MKACLVTGGAGFIGSHLVEELVKRGQRVRVLDNFLTGKKENLELVIDKIELIEGDIRDLATCQKAVQGMDNVFHLAAFVSVPGSVKDPLLNDAINVTGTLNLLWASREAKIQKFIFASSTAVYGDDPNLPKREGREGSPLSPYALSKLMGEKYCQLFWRLFNLPTISLRYFNVFGPRQDPFSAYAAVIPSFITRALSSQNLTIFGDGEQSRDFIYVTDVVEANLLASEARNVSGEVINIACAEKTTINSLVAQLGEILGKKISPQYEKSRLGDIRHSLADISRAKKMLKYEPRFTFKEGLEKTVAWFQGRKNERAKFGS